MSKETDLEEFVYGEYMRKAWMRAKAWRNKAAIVSPSAESFLGFNAAQVREVYRFKHGEGEAFWFRLKDGRVISWQGEASDTDPNAYEAPCQ